MAIGPTGPAAPPSINAGEQADALSNVQQAVQLLAEQISKFPVGSDEQGVLMDAVKKLSEIAPAGMGPPGVQVGTLKKLEDQAVQTSMLQHLLKTPGANGGAPAPEPAGPPGTLPGMI